MDTSQQNIGRLLTLAECEARTGRKVSTWRRDISKGSIPFVKLGRSVRVPETVIESMIRDGLRLPEANKAHRQL